MAANSLTTGTRLRQAGYWRAVLAALGVCLAVLALGGLGINAVEKVVVQQVVAVSSIYLRSLTDPLLKNLGTSGDLQPAVGQAIDSLLVGTRAGHQVITLKIWDSHGKILHSNRKWLSGRTFPITEELRDSFSGGINGAFQDLGAEENESERPIGIPILELYAPVRNEGSDKVVAVAEFYVGAEALAEDIGKIRWIGWTATFLLATGLAGACFAVLRKRS